MTSVLPRWITGSTQSGKTTRLLQQFCTWIQTGLPNVEPLTVAAHSRQVIKRSQRAQIQQTASRILVFAATGDDRLELAERLTTATQGQCPIESTTPLGFFQDEVLLFWPLLVQQLNLNAQFPIRLRPENEQELATRLWQPPSHPDILRQSGLGEYRLVRRVLDLMQLAALAGVPMEEIPQRLTQGVPGDTDWNYVGDWLAQWRSWCLERGLLTYSLFTELYGTYLLSHPIYQAQLTRRYRAILADDVDNYPAIAHQLFSILLDRGTLAAFTYNPNGSIRLGLGADPELLARLQERCQIDVLAENPTQNLATSLAPVATALVSDPAFLSQLPESVQSITTTDRSQLLRRTAEVIAAGIESGQVTAAEVVVIAPGLDAIARYTLSDILSKRGIAVASLNDQRPLASSTTVRALLTLLTLIYPGLGRLVDRDAIAEMLVILSQRSGSIPPGADDSGHPLTTPYAIDLVRANLLADHCFAPDPEQPYLLPVTAFPRWDRLGFQAVGAYETILSWISAQKLQLEQRLIPNAIALLDRAIQKFLWSGTDLPYDHLAALRELVETAQNYWSVDARLRQHSAIEAPAQQTVEHFIQLLRSGTITADPYPVRSLSPAPQAVTLATIFQYCSSHRWHRWQFWLDIGSPRWLTGTEGLFGSPLFLQNWARDEWSEDKAMVAYEQRLQRVLLTLMGRAQSRIFLCHSDLAVNGQEQMGPLLALVNAAVPFSPVSPA